MSAQTATLSFSVIINTFNRAASLRQTLDAVFRLEYDSFEVVVINGPSTDGTDHLLNEYAGRVKSATIVERNLSASRNVGIAVASADICAFIDDDAYPDPRWLADLAAGYTAADIAGVGGSTYDHTGYSFQARYLLSDRRGETVAYAKSKPNVSEVFSMPFGRKYPSLLGTNSSFRRSCLVEIGGFDEEFEYYLDETDVCLRLIDRGYALRNLESAFVYHKFLPSHLRNRHAVLRDRYSMIKSRAYFALRHRAADSSLAEVAQDIAEFVGRQALEYEWAVKQGWLSQADYEVFKADAKRAQEDALRRFQCGSLRTRPCEWFNQLRHPFLQHRVMTAGRRRFHVCFLSQEYPPETVSGIGRYTHQVAVELAARGHHVHVLTRGTQFHRVDLENGVWVHRLVPVTHELPRTLEVPQSIWDYSATLHDEVLRIHAARPLDLVEGPIWDSEGVATIIDGSVPFVLFLCTPLPVALGIHTHWQGQSSEADNHLKTLVEVEKFCVENAHAYHAISAAIAAEIETVHDVSLEPSRTQIAHLGIGEPLPPRADQGCSEIVNALFVGRLERRKGIDLVLESADPLLKRYPQLSITIVGDDSLGSDKGSSYRELYAGRLANYLTENRVRFCGRIDDSELEKYYSACDFLIVPSRYESFGLVLIEAMRHGKPAICGNEGGMREIVTDGESGLLIDTSGPEALSRAMSLLIEDRALRKRMGLRAREIYARNFTRSAMAARIEGFFEAIIDERDRQRRRSN